MKEEASIRRNVCRECAQIARCAHRNVHLVRRASRDVSRPDSCSTPHGSEELQ